MRPPTITIPDLTHHACCASTPTDGPSGLATVYSDETLVTSVDIDPDLVELAQERLAANGYTPTPAAVDGADGYPPGAHDHPSSHHRWPLPASTHPRKAQPVNWRSLVANACLHQFTPS